MDTIFDKTGFNTVYWSRYTEAEFIRECITDGVFKEYGDNRRTALKEVYKQIKIDSKRLTKQAPKV